MTGKPALQTHAHEGALQKRPSAAKPACRGTLSPGKRGAVFQVFEITGDAQKMKNMLDKSLDAVRNKGYAMHNEEPAVGLRCIGAPVFDHTRLPRDTPSALRVLHHE
jgi:hypothetical protein